jgi:hypothetical protein
MNGKTIGTIVGPVTFIPGVGVRLEAFESRIVYELPEPLEDGEMSALVTGVTTNTEGDKTKIFSMAQGYGDLTANPRRMTVEKRGDSPPGAIAWRFLPSGGDGVDTVGAERVVRQFDPNLVYFWEADWRDGLPRAHQRRRRHRTEHLRLRQGIQRLLSARAARRLSGGGPARGGPSGQTVPGMIIRQVWVSQRPRGLRQQVRTANPIRRGGRAIGPTAFMPGFSARPETASDSTRQGTGCRTAAIASSRRCDVSWQVPIASPEAPVALAVAAKRHGANSSAKLACDGAACTRRVLPLS